jgi:translation initiation factor IF-3
MASPPVCKILNFGKYQYELDKKEKLAKKHQKIVHLKEVKIRPNIGQHDLEIKLKHADEFLADGDKVKFSLRFKGREAAHKEIGFALFIKIKLYLEGRVKIEQDAKMEGAMNIVMIVSALSVPKA